MDERLRLFSNDDANYSSVEESNRMRKIYKIGVGNSNKCSNNENTVIGST